MQPAFTNPSVQNEPSGNWDALALSLNLFGLSFLFIFVSCITGTLGAGMDIWRWLTDQNNAKET